MIRIVCLLTLLCTGCTKFDNPLVAEGGRTVDPALLGVWVAEDEKGSAHFDIRRDAAVGKITVIEHKPGGDETEEYQLITAKLGHENFASVKLIGDAEATWTFLRYEIAGDRLRVSHDNGYFWRKAIEDEMLSGSVTVSRLSTTVHVSASEKELREFVLGYGGAIFKPEIAAELERE